MDVSGSPFYQADTGPDAESTRALLEELADLRGALATGAATAEEQQRAVAVVVDLVLGVRS